mgnify:FL=1
MTSHPHHATLAQLSNRLGQRAPEPIEGSFPNAAVLVPIVTEGYPEPEVVLTRRSMNLNSHAGEIAFPGGKQDPEDTSLTHTALRETWEEIGLDGDKVNIIGELDQIISKAGIRVYPFVGTIAEPVEFVLNPDELDELFTVPLGFFLEEEPDFFEVRHNGYGWRIPQYIYKEFRIWGLTAMILVNMMNLAFDKSYPLRVPVRKA